MSARLYFLRLATNASAYLPFFLLSFPAASPASAAAFLAATLAARRAASLEVRTGKHWAPFVAALGVSLLSLSRSLLAVSGFRSQTISLSLIST